MQYEVEIKSLLGSEESAQTLRERMKVIDPQTTLTSRNTQLNHYFTAGDASKLSQRMREHLAPDAAQKLSHMLENGKDFSVRTRLMENGDHGGAVFLVIKASVGDDTSSNGVARLEFQEAVSMPLDELDQLLLECGFQYQAKWSRQREEYLSRGISVALDKNAGYGWLAEFEKIVGDESQLDAARREVRMFMEQCGVHELQQDRLERMFAFYNAHWGEYYGTDKVFTIA